MTKPIESFRVDFNVFKEKIQRFKTYNGIARWFHRTVSIEIIDPTHKKSSFFKKLFGISPNKKIVYFDRKNAISITHLNPSASNADIAAAIKKIVLGKPQEAPQDVPQAEIPLHKTPQQEVPRPVTSPLGSPTPLLMQISIDALSKLTEITDLESWLQEHHIDPNSKTNRKGLPLSILVYAKHNDLGLEYLINLPEFDPNLTTKAGFSLLSRILADLNDENYQNQTYIPVVLKILKHPSFDPNLPVQFDRYQNDQPAHPISFLIKTQSSYDSTKDPRNQLIDTLLKNPTIDLSKLDLSDQIELMRYLIYKKDINLLKSVALKLDPKIFVEENVFKESLLNTAFKTGDEPVIQFIFEHTKDRLTREMLENLCFAAISTHQLPYLKIFAATLANQYKVHLPDIRSEEGKSLMHAAGSAGSIPIAQFLKENGLDYQTLNKEGESLVHLAAMNGQNSLIEFLQQTGLDLSQQTKEGKTPLHYAVHHISTFKYLLPLTSLDQFTPQQHSLLLHEAIKTGNVEFLELLRDQFAKHINSQDQDGNSLLTEAVVYAPQFLQELIKIPGIDWNAADKRGSTPLHILAQKGDLANFKMLFHNPNTKKDAATNFGDSYLHSAVYSQNLELVKWILANTSLDINAQNNEGHTPLFTAIVRYHGLAAGELPFEERKSLLEVIKFLKDYPNSNLNLEGTLANSPSSAKKLFKGWQMQKELDQLES